VLDRVRRDDENQWKMEKRLSVENQTKWNKWVDEDPKVVEMAKSRVDMLVYGLE
jgi:hypothetical protein